MKSFIKEFGIILLLCITTCLVLGVIFYDYIPTNKVVPSNVEAYKTSETIKDEISQEVVEYPKQNITLEITESDLTMRKQDKTYSSGKADPFALEVEKNENTTNEVQNTVSAEQPKNNSNPDSTDHFFNSTGGIK